MNFTAGARMSLIDHVLKPVGFPWLNKRARGGHSEEAVVPPVPSLASIEYELTQLRASLRGVVDFKDPQASPAKLGGMHIVAKPLPPRRHELDG